MPNDLSTGLRLAEALLLKEGEISLDEIAALPFVEDDETAYAIALALVNRLAAEHVHRRAVGDDGCISIEEVIRIRPDDLGMAMAALA